MNKTLLAFAVIALGLSACSEKKEAAPAAAEPAAAESTANLHPTCTEYFKRVEACMSKADKAAAEQVRVGLEQTKQSIAAADSSTQETICKQSNDMFGETAKAMQCE